ncbi:D-alanyl-D-alanine carboxypeptidase family protein [Wenxinia marina]|uniref:serine-type D-Ala-D-Ala carboxypeptidase n=1 Tax=Wenxinia marina DSM 24838 TaxID=1123501 RepID=A0A0D0QD15_9RHOB|nr:D-alanyl-D-alanine carboxypeptidase family protein [Wenxinia marina]KIQ70187.1 D-alanyl-D-alanine carboxypeptidase [Wenxinia marina DSM 24838]GGL50742.1 D-alanyl-D-alanine carboxypeptidase [Wenxinia marina]
MRRIATALLALTGALWFATLAAAQGLETEARAAYVFDQTTGTVLFEHNADEPLPPASMSKLMTLYMTFEAISQGRLDVNEELLVSEHAASFGGSSMFLRAGERVRVEDLLRGVIVLSGNDASVVLAEALGGTEASFAQMMTEKARAMGMNNSTFANASGWPAAGHAMSVRDLGILADHIIRDFPTFYPLFAEQEFAFDNRVPANSQNRNPILGLGIGADGLKTGHTTEAGYGLVGSAKQGDRRIVFVVTGLDTTESRREEAERIVNWAFRQFAERELGAAGTQLAEAGVWMGAETSVGLTLADDLRVLLPASGTDGYSAEVAYTAPITAPIAAGQELGELRISRDGLPDIRVPLVADRDVAPGGVGVRLRTAAQILVAKVAPGATLPGMTGAAPAGDEPAAAPEAEPATEDS